jgi:hypothetical protein
LIIEDVEAENRATKHIAAIFKHAGATSKGHLAVNLAAFRGNLPGS